MFLRLTPFLFSAGAEEKFSSLAPKAESLIETYPSQAQFIFYAGLAFNQLQQFKKSKGLFRMGMVV
jgi:hypothetical protein